MRRPLTLSSLLCLGLLCGAAGCADEPVAGGGPDMAVSPPPRSGLQITVRSSDDLAPIPARVLVYPQPGTTAPSFGSNGKGASDYAPTVLGATRGLFLSTGQATFAFPEGTYELVILQGPEYEQVRRTVSLKPQEGATLDVTLEHSVNTTGWLAADMHIHTKVSYDGHVLSQHRVVTEVSSGVEVIVPTEHGLHYAFDKEIDALGYKQRVATMPGSEYTFAGGHLGVYPVRYEPLEKLLGAPAWQEWPKPLGYRDTMAFPMVHALPTDPLLVVNHPRLPPDLGYFLNTGWPHFPGEKLETAKQIDGLELLNGYQQSPAELTALLKDWFFLLNDGQRVTALGNSDTHMVDSLVAGYPRSYLRLPTEEPARVLPDDIRSAVRGMRAIATNGPFLQLTVDGRDIGETAVVRSGQVRLHVTADAASWIDLKRVMVYRNGDLLLSLPVTQRTHPALDTTVDLPVAVDGWIVAVAVGAEPLPVDVIGAVKGGQVRPFAITNPIWIDADGDSQIKPPGGVPRPDPYANLLGDLVITDEPPRLWQSQSLHTPLDCEPSELPDWLR
jgi:hypothetical protein